MVYRIYVEKKPGLDQEARALQNDARTFLGVQGLEKVRIFNRYDAENISEELFALAVREVFSEPQLDNTFSVPDTEGASAVFAVEYLPGQFDQRADSAAQCIQIISRRERPRVASARVSGISREASRASTGLITYFLISPISSAAGAP